MKESIRKENLIKIITVIFLTVLMTGISEILDDKEIIFPEIAALAVGYVCAPKRSWMVNSARMFILITSSAVIGLLISLFMPGSLYIKVLTAFIVAQLIYMYSGTSLAPLISAVVLPVLIESDSVSYIISAAGMTAAIILFHEIFVKKKILPDESYTPEPAPDKEAYLRFLARTAFAAAFLIIALKSGWRFMAAPPLLVAFTELSEHWSPSSSLKPYRVILLLTGCALAGSACRYIFTMRLGLPLTFAALLAAAIMLAIIYLTGLFMPPAGAITILAMLIPEGAVILYPLEALIGVSAFMAVSVLISQKLK